MAAVRIDSPQLTNQDIRRFWKRVDKSLGHGPNGECWKWTRGTIRGGYGAMYVDKPRRKCAAHRLAFLIEHDYWPTLLVCHTCDWPPCCNPAHLFEGDSAANTQDAMSKGRQPQGETHNNSKLTANHVLAIRAIYACHDRTLREIGDIFCVSAQTVLVIVERKAWAHI